MIYSMTAFARTQKQVQTGHLCWEIRSVNHRYLDVFFRLPEAFRFMETALRSLLRDRINRGKLECYLKYQEMNNSQPYTINKKKVDELLYLSNQLTISHNLTNDLSLAQILSWPGILQLSEENTEELEPVILSLFSEALLDLIKVRAEEGASLSNCIDSNLQALIKEIARSKLLCSSMAAQTKEKLLARLAVIRLETTESRVEQEIALLLSRLDVNEELDRLQVHVNEVSRILSCDNLAGRRLDFLMQELNREANTLSSKSDSSELTQSAIEMKVLIEQMREQVQNIE